MPASFHLDFELWQGIRPFLTRSFQDNTCKNEKLLLRSCFNTYFLKQEGKM
jgi:hypothetical protein